GPLRRELGAQPLLASGRRPLVDDEAARRQRAEREVAVAAAEEVAAARRVRERAGAPGAAHLLAERAVLEETVVRVAARVVLRAVHLDEGQATRRSIASHAVAVSVPDQHAAE